MSKPLRIIFAGTPEFAAQHLAALIKANHDIVAVYCPPDKPAGRGKKLTACATKNLALAHDIVVEQPENFKEQSAQQQLADYHADVMIVVAYGLLLPTVILETPRLGCINVHGSLLPKWRGAAPIQRSLEAGDQQTGVTIMQMDKGLDTGDMILTECCDITRTDTSATLYEKLAVLGPTALLKTLTLMTSGVYPRTPQDNTLSTYAKKLDKTEAELQWTLTADKLDRKVRAYNPWPVAQFTYIENKGDNDKLAEHRIRVLKSSVVYSQSTLAPGTIISVSKLGILVATGDGAINLEILQLPGKKALPVQDILNGRGEWFQPNKSINGWEKS